MLGYTVTEIGDYAFMEYSGVVLVTLPESVGSVGEYAFAEKPDLRFVTIPRSCKVIAEEELVPFADELEHTRAYLAVEHAQHEDMLYVEYDTPHVNFYVPPLTLQPLVENAVKHSFDPNGDPLYICVRTRQADNRNEIIVENNGLDYQPSNDNEPHIALSNIKRRLQIMCKGELTIAPREGGGTVVKVIIPGAKA